MNELDNTHNGLKMVRKQIKTMKKKKKFCAKRFFLCNVRGEQFSDIYIYIYIFLLELVTIVVLNVTVFFFLQLSDASLQWNFSSLYSPSLLYLSPVRVDHIADLNTSPISTFLKSLELAVRLKITVQVSPPH